MNWDRLVLLMDNVVDNGRGTRYVLVVVVVVVAVIVGAAGGGGT